MYKKLVILGAGESGIGAAILAQQKGYDVFVSDGGIIQDKHKETLHQYQIKFEEASHTKEIISKSPLIVKSPGILATAPIIQECVKRKIKIVDELEFAFKYKENSKIISVTGSNGKTTTASLIYHIIQQDNQDVALVGNIGDSFAKQIVLNKKPIYVVEVSSFQLDYIDTYQSDIAILLNITPDHLNAYNNDFRKYVDSKFRIIKNSQEGNTFIYSVDDKNIKTYINNYSIKSHQISFSIMNNQKSNQAYVDKDNIIININEDRVKIPISAIPLIGKHNLSNTMAASVATMALGIRKETIQKAIQSFQSVDHRMEYLGTFGGVVFINDSKATNINSTWYALESMNRPVVLIMGGKDKGNQYEDIEEVVKQKVKSIICLGLDNTEIIKTFKGKVPNMVETTSMDEAVQAAFERSSQGDVILLSPACASFDLFDNYEDRGKKFKEAIMKL